MNIKNFIEEHRRQLPLTILIFVFLLSMLWIYGFYYESRIGPEQPIPFSHRIHANEKEISCLFCHDRVTEAGVAGIPPLETCMLCHQRIIIHHPEIEKLRAYYDSNEPVEWIKIAEIPDFVFFNHSVHIFRQIDCYECHGNLREMDRVEMVHDFQMGFCIECHREKNASLDCFTCHR